MNPRLPIPPPVPRRMPISRVANADASDAVGFSARLRAARMLLPALLCAASATAAGDFTRGVGVYPGDPAAFQGPTMVPDAAAYRNLALHRPATASSNYDYSLTAQLITDGIIDGRMPRWLVASSSAEGILPQPRAAPSGDCVEQLRLQPDSPANHRRDHRRPDAPLARGVLERGGHPAPARAGAQIG